MEQSEDGVSKILSLPRGTMNGATLRVWSKHIGWLVQALLFLEHTWVMWPGFGTVIFVEVEKQQEVSSPLITFITSEVDCEYFLSSGFFTHGKLKESLII